MWQKRKLHIMCNSFFCDNVYKSHLLQLCQTVFIRGKKLKLEYAQEYTLNYKFIYILAFELTLPNTGMETNTTEIFRITLRTKDPKLATSKGKYFNLLTFRRHWSSGSRKPDSSFIVVRQIVHVILVVTL